LQYKQYNDYQDNLSSVNFMNRPKILFSQEAEKELLDVLIKLAGESSNERVDVMGTPIPMFNFSTSVLKIFKAWKKREPTLSELQEVSRLLERLSERLIEFGADYEPVPLLSLSKLYHDKNFIKQAGIEVQLNGYVKLLDY
tara:strand:+ start:1051 stop:1473 length:423 start_codon:yes stop_codon:yes gene_type:complete